MPLRARSSRVLGRRQQGAALLFAVLLVVVGASVFTINTSAETARIAQSEERLSVALGRAKDALVALAAAHPTRPGAFPCPDTDDDGVADAIMFTGACPSYLGRLPWRTLGVGDLYDESGERLWYALSDNWRDFPQINSDTKGNRTVYSGSATVTQTPQAVAVLFAPGFQLGNQQRDDVVAACATTGTATPRRRCAANYLEASGGINNSGSANGPFIGAQASETFNDRLLPLRTSDIVPLLERRVAHDLRRTLLNYRETSRQAILGGGCNCFPWADSSLNGISNNGQNRGRIPLTATPHNWGATLTVGGTPYVLPNLPGYFASNGWQRVIFYAVGRNALQNFGVACASCTGDPMLPPPLLLQGTLSIDKEIGHAVVLITPGSAGANRPAGWTGNWGDYIDDGPNRDGDDRFVRPTSTSHDRDRLFTVPDDLPPQACSANAKTLVYNAPCHTTGSNVKAVCQKAVQNLNMGCTCSGDGSVMVTEPCRNSLNPPECQAAVTSLNGCKV